jgi:hypothetical protein
MLIQRELDLHDGGENGEDRWVAYLDSATVAMRHARVAAARRAHGGRVRHATHWLRMTEHGPEKRSELKQQEQCREYLHRA